MIECAAEGEMGKRMFIVIPQLPREEAVHFRQEPKTSDCAVLNSMMVVGKGLG